MENFDKEDFANFITNKVEQLDLCIKVGQNVCQVHSVDVHEEGEQYVFGWWSAHILTGIKMTDEQFLIKTGKVDVLDEGKKITVQVITADECANRWDDVKKVPDLGDLFMHEGKQYQVGENAMFGLEAGEITVDLQPEPNTKWISVPFNKVDKAIIMQN